MAEIYDWDKHRVRAVTDPSRGLVSSGWTSRMTGFDKPSHSAKIVPFAGNPAGATTKTAPTATSTVTSHALVPVSADTLIPYDCDY